MYGRLRARAGRDSMSSLLPLGHPYITIYLEDTSKLKSAPTNDTFCSRRCFLFNFSIDSQERRPKLCLNRVRVGVRCLSL